MENVKYIGPQVLTAPEIQQYIDFPEIIQRQVALDPPKEVLEALYELFGIKPGRKGFAGFEMPPLATIKSLFKIEVFPKYKIDQALDKINTAISLNNQTEAFEEYIDQLFSMLYKLTDLNEILEEVRSRMTSILRS
jgi:hypothetical protein